MRFAQLKFSRICCFLICTIVSQFSSIPEAAGLGMEAFGPAEHVGAAGEWPFGVRPLLKHPSRVYWQDVNGYSQSYYDGDIEQINELLELFSKIKLKRHQVILQLGQGSAKSFQGKATSFAVKFDLPAGLFIHHAKEHAKSGLYSTTPTLVVHINDEMINKLDQLKVPAPIELYRSQYDPKRLLEAANNAETNPRCRALGFLADFGLESEETRKAIQKGIESGNQYVVRSASRAKEKLDAQKGIDAKLRDKFAKYLEQHPRWHRLPTPEELLKELEQTDAKYATEGFTARGTLVNGEGNLMNWVATMGNNRLALRTTAVDEKAIGRVEHTIFVSPNDMVTIQRSQYWVDGKLIKSKPFESIEPVGNTYDLLIGRVLWPIGRSFTRRIDRIESVEEQHDGTLTVVAIGENNLGIRWELEVDPFADYLVTHARGYRVRKGKVGELDYLVDAAGVVKSDGRSTNHTAWYREGKDATPISMAVSEVTSEADLNLIVDLEEGIVDRRKTGKNLDD